jgi:tetratricopeptide (TPR) repeat protein
MTFAPERQGQFGKYTALLQQGRLSIDAAREAFGDLDQLRRDLHKYLDSRSMSFLNLKPEMLSTDGAVEVHALSDGAGEMMPVRIRSKVGVTPETAPAVLADARKVAARYKSDPFVLAALAEAEHDAGHEAEAIAAADAALAADPKEVNAYVQKGYALFALAEEADDDDAAYARAIQPFVALNKIENDHPLPLVYYFRSYIDRGATPPVLASQGLQRAVELAPFDTGLRMTLAFQQLQHGDIALARSNFEPVAFDPHGGGAGKVAQAILARLDASDTPPSEEEIGALIQQANAASETPASGAGKE